MFLAGLDAIGRRCGQQTRSIPAMMTPSPSSRRTFLRSAIAVSAAAGLHSTSALALPEPSPASPVHLGLASYTLRNFSRADVIADMKTLHLTRLNCKDAKDHLPMTPPDALKAALADYAAAGITVTAVGTVDFKKPENFRSNFEYARAAGVKVMVAGNPAASALGDIEKLVKEYDIRLAIHNHGPEDPAGWHSPLDILAAVKNLDPRMGCCIDIGHCLRAGTDPVEAVRKVGPRLFDMHAKDLADASSKESQVAVGQGIMPIPGIFKALIAIKYPGNVDLEYEIFPQNPMPGVIESFGYMRGVLAGMGYKA